MLQTTRELRFNHFVVATTDGTIFASARDKLNKIHNFLITRYGDVRRQVRGRFEPVSPRYAENIREKARSCYSVVPVYRIRAINFS